ncbi:zinc-binding alcohol dehydrogenase [Aquibacillus sp. 3ASR75-11]|uniref:Zinc-binding alcohol dehydrogenase n=1 Tax=Terrihalobacillus insolitus TaxID=2950438 RepID=A0A9X3WQ36_9BACI|nr:zinc-binding alcohol dehydrogenase [Terrihalobacillus insolitus]MDC3412172.1 zinc-binding alcohol dehydrogenase [Terrihalobacillus insolitus]MDC3423135.1 zinc-binding alcohol dehydrogenase [Terrihalobacillus insolitus]
MRKLIAQQKRAHIVEDDIPIVKDSYILVKTMYSAISAGTEVTILENSKDTGINMGYSAMGVVEECGSGITDVQKGDLVACYGAPYVHHQEYLLVPKTLYAKVPNHVKPQEASLAGLGAIAIHALRIADLQFGETAVVIGLGVLGQMIAKIANAAAYNVIACDLSKERTNMLDEPNIKSFTSIEEMENEIQHSTNGQGADAVLLCTSGKRSQLTHESLKWIRNKGKVVIVGDIEPDFPRNLMFAKEAQLFISRAGGPGRYDNVYEQHAIDYPYGFIRWTEGRNIAEYIRLVSEKRINVKPFITEEVDFSDAPGAYEELQNKQSTTLTKLINYNEQGVDLDGKRTGSNYRNWCDC